MENMKILFPGSWKAGVLTASLCVAAVPGVAQEVTLTSVDSSLTVTGELLDFTGDTYIIETNIGPLRVTAEGFVCTGDGCPNVQAETDGPVVWDVSLWGSRRAFTEHVERIAELIDDKTGGEFTLALSYGGLSPSRENLDGIAAGTFEMAQFCAGYHPEKNPSITVMELPFLGVDSLEQEVELSLAVYEHPATVADMARWNATLLMPSPQPQNNIIGVGFPPTSLAAFSNMTIRASGGARHAIEALGAESITIPAPAVKDALSNGEVDAVAFAPHAHMAFETIDSGTWWTTNLNPGTSNCPVVVNTTALERLSTPHRVALLSSVDEALEHYVNNYNSVTMSAWGPALRDNEIVEITINDEIVSAINEEVAGPAAAAWIAETEAKGLPAQELYDLVTNMIAASN
ncbi:C4-dicarboxylate ABC transporter substrate-binding protein [Yoonia sp. F2084L]|uniref:C4-dicarboxylate ABC transporter substrate-binding protein n=1 Tax=Yoonia sp. F2084L TaxID=2926419 RepID=UPI001FF57B35|nr:C4-dicarboxylate ABC transporter substrate-binding protein [Yoonia sp. F2084L]MCK0095235.1 C4-dicarboxylate ABC transporter substrate-binding protein [Yoonia sp. F2084L]